MLFAVNLFQNYNNSDIVSELNKNIDEIKKLYPNEWVLEYVLEFTRFV